MSDRIEKLEQLLKKELDDAIKDRDFDSARQIYFALESLLDDGSRKFNQYDLWD